MSSSDGRCPNLLSSWSPSWLGPDVRCRVAVRNPGPLDVVRSRRPDLVGSPGPLVAYVLPPVRDGRVCGAVPEFPPVPEVRRRDGTGWSVHWDSPCTRTAEDREQGNFLRISVHQTQGRPREAVVDLRVKPFCPHACLNDDVYPQRPPQRSSGRSMDREERRPAPRVSHYSITLGLSTFPLSSLEGLRIGLRYGPSPLCLVVHKFSSPL